MTTPMPPVMADALQAMVEPEVTMGQTREILAPAVAAIEDPQLRFVAILAVAANLRSPGVGGSAMPGLTFLQQAIEAEQHR